MADPKSVDIVELKIEAENLSIGELTETADALGSLGSAARAAEKDLQKLEVKQDTINSYRQISQSVQELRADVDQAELSYDKLAKALKENKNATDQEVLAVKAAKRELTGLTRELRDQETEYRKLGKSLKAYEVDTKNLDAVQDRLTQQIKETSAESAKLNSEYLEQAQSLRQRIQVEKEALVVSQQAEQAEAERQAQLAQTTAAQEKLQEAARKTTAAEATRIANQAKVNASLVEYEQGLRELNNEMDDSILTTADYIREEERLRQSLELTEGQTKTIRAALRAEVEDRKKAERAIAEQVAEQTKLATAQEKAANEARQTAAAERAAAVEIERVKQSVKEYEIELEKLNAEKTEGRITTGQYIRSEEQLRRTLSLNSNQVLLSRRAIEADAKGKGAATRNTDLLTQATRRLAQVYTVLLAAQKATQAVSQSVTEYGDLEAAITKVEKTTGIARQQTEQLAEVLNELATTTTPTATNELLRYAEVAGQLGTKSTADLLRLVAAADALENSTDLAGDEAINLLARILTMTGEGIPEIDSLASSIVALGNDFAASESQIAQMTKEIVSGTREINLSSAAAAAFGATLAELGQPAERSRTAIQRLAGAIKEAAVSGGDDLERLIKVTGLAGDQIIESLGTEPEKVLVAFLKGLNQVNESGGQMSQVLNSIGIDGSEALGVLTVLSGGTNRLEEALKLSNEQFIAADGHMKEAAKSYANQEAALARLGNKFTDLKKRIGEAFSDDTENAIKAVGDIIDDTGDSVITLMEHLPELVAGLGEAIGSLSSMVDGFVSDSEGLGLIDAIINTIKLSVNGLTGTIRIIQIGLKEMAVTAIETYNQLQVFDDLKIGTQAIDDLRESIRQTQEAINTDVDDINNAWARMRGESSVAFEGLITAAEKYTEASARLSAEQQAAITNIITKNQYSAEEDSLYRQLTASLVRANREMQIEAELKVNSVRLSQESVEAKAQEVTNTEAVAESQNFLNTTLQDYITRSTQVQEAISRIATDRANGIISDTDAAAATEILTDLMARYNIVIDEQSAATVGNTASVAENAEKRKELFQQYQDGVISEAEFAAGMNQLSDNFKLATTAVQDFTDGNEDSSLAQAKFANEILKSEKKIADYNKQLENANLIEADAARIKAKLALEEEKLNVLRADQSRLMEIENANYRELTQLQTKYQRELEQLTLQFTRGALTKAEYEEKTRSLILALNELNAIIRENTDVTDENTAAVERSAGAVDKKAESSAKAISYMSLELAAAQHLNKEYDFSSASLEQLGRRQRELTNYISENNRVSSVWWRQLAVISNEVFRQEKAVISATLAMRQMQDQVERGNLNMNDLDRLTRQANASLYALSEQQMTPLLQAIDQAKRELQSLSDTIDDSFDNVQDRLDRALGNEESIVKRQFQREIDEYLALLDKARAAGDQALVNKVNQVLTDLRKAQNLEYQAQFGENAPAARTRTNQTTTGQTAPAPATTPSTPAGENDKVVLQLQIGGNTYDTTTDRGTLRNIVAAVNREKQIGV